MLALSGEYTYLNSIVSFLLKTENSTLAISLSLLTAKAELRSLSMDPTQVLNANKHGIKRCMEFISQCSRLYDIFKNESVDFFRIKDGKISPLIDYIDDFTFLYSDLG